MRGLPLARPPMSGQRRLRPCPREMSGGRIVNDAAYSWGVSLRTGANPCSLQTGICFHDLSAGSARFGPRKEKMERSHWVAAASSLLTLLCVIPSEVADRVEEVVRKRDAPRVNRLPADGLRMQCAALSSSVRRGHVGKRTLVPSATSSARPAALLGMTRKGERAARPFPRQQRPPLGVPPRSDAAAGVTKMTVQVSRDALMASGQTGDDMRDGNAMRPDRYTDRASCRAGDWTWRSGLRLG